MYSICFNLAATLLTHQASNKS